jgi:hypothetical protein
MVVTVNGEPEYTIAYIGDDSALHRWLAPLRAEYEARGCPCGPGDDDMLCWWEGLSIDEWKEARNLLT